MSAQVLLKVLNKLKKKDKMQSHVKHFIAFCNKFNKSKLQEPKCYILYLSQEKLLFALFHIII